MAQISITITVPDAQSTDILNTVTDYLGYANGVTRTEFLRQKVRDHLKGWYKTAKGKIAYSLVTQAESAAEAVTFT